MHDYGRALRAAEQAGEKRAAVQQELEAVWRELQNTFASRGPAEDLARLQAYSHTVQQRCAERERAVQLAHGRVRESFVKLVAARQAAAVLDKHFENQKRHHQHERRRHEQKILDDLAARRSLLRAIPPLRPDPTWN